MTRLSYIEIRLVVIKRTEMAVVCVVFSGFS